MKKPRDPVIAFALDYERGTLDALARLDGTDTEAQILACVCYGDAVTAMEAMPERDRALTYLMQRGRIPDFSWKRIYAAMQILAANFNAVH